MGRWTVRAVLLLAVGSLTGCNGKADVTGRVIFRGKPVIYGSVMMVAADGSTVVGPIRPDGTYAVSGVKTGEVLVGIISHDPTVAQKVHNIRWAKATRGIQTSVPAAVDKRKWFALPAKLEEPETSGIKIVLTGGTQDIVID